MSVTSTKKVHSIRSITVYNHFSVFLKIFGFSKDWFDFFVESSAESKKLEETSTTTSELEQQIEKLRSIVLSHGGGKMNK